MKGYALRTQAAAAVALLGLFSIGSGLAFLVQAEAQTRLELSQQRELSVLVKLPQLRERLRRVDEATRQYLLAGGAVRLEARQKALRELRRVQGELSSLPGLGGEPAWSRFDRELEAALADQGASIAEKEAGRLAAADAAQLASREPPLDRTLDPLVEARDRSVADLGERLAAARSALRAMTGLIMGTGFLAALALAWLLSRRILRPVLGLERSARLWQLGRPWEPPFEEAGPEVESLAACMKDMAGRLNTQYERELELGRFKTQLVAVVSHEFNNALNVIGGVAALLQETEGSSPPERRKQYYDMLNSNTRLLAIASTNLLNLGRLDSGKFAVRPRKTDAGELLKEGLSRLELLAQRKRLETALELPEAPLFINGDPEALSLVVTNLLSNAIKYTPEGGRVRAGAARLPGEEGRAVLFVRDSGIGIAPEEQEKVFSGWYRTEAGQEAAKGFGVGLSLARKIVEAHGGALGLESAVGEGSTFYFELPLWKEDAAMEAAPASASMEEA